MLSSVAPQVARETDSCEKVQERTRRDVHASPDAGMVSAEEDSPPRKQFYRNEISNCFSLLLSCSSSRSHVCFIRVFKGNYFELFRLNSEKFRFHSSLHLTWKNYIFFLIVSTKNNSQQQGIYILRDITFKWPYLRNTFWLRIKKKENVTSPLSCTKNSHPYEKSTWGGKKSLRVFTHHPSGSQRQDSCLF